MQTLSQIEAEIQFLADESTLTVSSGTLLPVLNNYYKLFCGMRAWPELAVTDSSITLVQGQEAYRWPVNYSFITEPALLLQRTLGNPRNYVKVWPVQDEIYWGFLKNVVQSFPSHYKKERQDANTYSLLLRPNPNVTGLQLLIAGQVEPIPFVLPADRSCFREEKTDMAFSRFVAAQFQKKRNNSGRAAELIDEMEDMLPDSVYTPSARPTNVVPWVT